MTGPTRDCICSSVTLKIFWVIHGNDPDKRKRTFTRHAECNYCNRAYKDIPERAMRRERQALAARMQLLLSDAYTRYPFLKRYLKRTTSA
ncbi:MAG: hypothetical protein A3C93_04320 [Candidatus Lloydbacteria bacterium RIFCSPHIGHO2_02_FULL_54_17]|uniref:Uncharacterized protein n=1 Tax=Candidatus Lloydbacteria bacterium RIFCSPHIGHO2_02_FULL_54_17 TaxID=1798664 RepID=A0A1G2DD97_9BACT|nr:MAG: hypothetical protein A3C93_04320 [Candidatus Lloydbacteria bacterium RIFCSPHIGHO2_02_FULL_54_17]